jgi:hypothetical protein
MTLNEIWQLLNEVLRADSTKEIDKKMRAINEGYLHFAKRMLIVGNYIPELLSDIYNINTVAEQNHVALPSDFLGLHTIFYKNGDVYTRVDNSQIKEFKYLLEQTDGNFVDTTDQGLPSIFAIKEPNLYFDKHYESVITSGIKLLYHKIPATLIAYDKITLESVTGTFQVGEIINQISDSGSTMAFGYVRDITTVGSNIEITMLTSTRRDTFYDGFEVQGSESSANGIQTGDMVEKPQTLEIGSKYKPELVNACALKYLYFDDDIEAEAKNKTFESELLDIKDINKYDADFNIGIGR